MKFKKKLHALRASIRAIGFRRTCLFIFDIIVNKIIFFDIFHVIILDRENIKRPTSVNDKPITFQFATLEDLLKFKSHPEFDIDETKLSHFREGDVCLLNYVKEELAGYTWGHLHGRPLLLPGLRLQIPNDYIYNFSALTLSKFKGQRHQGMRHYELLNQKKWNNKKGLLGYVKYTNSSSQRGQKKSGYKYIGSMWLIGSKKNFIVLLSKNLKAFGVRRTPA